MKALNLYDTEDLRYEEDTPIPQIIREEDILIRYNPPAYAVQIYPATKSLVLMFQEPLLAMNFREW